MRVAVWGGRISALTQFQEHKADGVAILSCMQSETGVVQAYCSSTCPNAQCRQ